MIFDELQSRFGPYVAELVRQALTLEEFAELEIEELASYFELRAERVYQEYRGRLESPLPDTPGENKEEYLNTLRRRWQQAEELAHLVLTAEASAAESERLATAGRSA